MYKRTRVLLAILCRHCGPVALVDLPQVLPASWLQSVSRMCPYTGVPVGLNWRTLFPPRGAITYYLNALPAGRLYASDSQTFVEQRLLRCFEIVTKETTFWSSHFRNILACSHVLSRLNPAGTNFELRLCYRELFGIIVNLCKFPQPIAAILESC